MTPEQIEHLLHEEEGTSLDFKRDQYKFDQASKEDKSELLKDILAFTNAFRRNDAYILVGVEEIRGGRSKVVGIETQLDDAKLQQFVNSKTQRSVTFSYREATHDGHAIGIIHIPIQSRPVYATHNYGKVLKEKVYLRRGSSTDTASPDEIANMGTTGADWTRQPSVEVNLFERKSGEILGDTVSVDWCTLYDVPPCSEIPDYEPDRSLRMGNVNFLSEYNFTNDRNYWRDFAKYLKTADCFPVALEMQNTGGMVIHDTRLVIQLHDPAQRFKILTPRNLPKMPRPSSAMRAPILNSIFEKQDVSVTREIDSWKVECNFGKIQPGATMRLRDDFLIECRSVGEVRICGLIYSDNISSPIPVRIQLVFHVEGKVLSVEDIQQMASEYIGKT